MVDLSYALVDRDDEIKPFLGTDVGIQETDPQLDLITVFATELIEGQLGRKIVSRGSITEFHSPRRPVTSLYLREYPILTVTSVHEDSGRTFDATTLLVEDTDYIVSKPTGKLIRISSSLETSWVTGFRPEQVIYTGGYLSTATVPPKIKFECLKLIGIILGEASRNEWGLSSISDDSGNLSRLVPSGVTSVMARELEEFARHEQEPTWESD